MTFLDNQDPLISQHKSALDWFLTNAGLIRSWREIEKQADNGRRLATLAKGIYKPAYTHYALSVRQTLTSSYGDKEIVHRPDGSWVYPYFQENPDPDQRDSEATNRGLMHCLRDGVPIGVMIQTKPKPGVEYLVLGLGRVIEWDAGYFIIEKYARGSTTTAYHDAAIDYVRADIAALTFAPHEIKREWQIRQVLKRRGQSRFRSLLFTAYKGRCAISGCDAAEALEAAHISPYSMSGSNASSNGLLLRADLHTLFDLGLIAVSPLNFTVLLHPKLGESSYSELSGRMIALPENADDRPDVDALSDHGCWAGLFNRRPE
ncbi:HNH endonuclease [Pararhizobium sp.]|uniref:HNH endonuclease n=1 Tax=Pararhizobium sp. TaxID=1977563 RepID=UPI003D0D4F87